MAFPLDENVAEQSNKPSVMQIALAINKKAKNSHASDKYIKAKVNFSNVNLPHWLPLSCGVFGCSVQSLGCILTSFTSKAEPETSREIWNISLLEFEWRHQEEDSETPVELEEIQIEIGMEEDSPDIAMTNKSNTPNLFNSIKKPFS